MTEGYPPAPSSLGRRSLWLLAGLALVYMLAFAWRGSILSSDDTIFALMVREMLAGGSWLDLRLQGYVSHQRPPLAVWVLAASVRAFGEGELALRLPGVLAGAASLLLVAQVGTRLYGRAAGLLSAGALASSTLFYYTARRVLTDPMLLALLLGGVAVYLDVGRSKARWALLGVLAGAALMVKQMVPLLVLGPLALHHLWTGRWRRSGAAGPLLCAAALLAVLAPWHVAQTLRWGAEFWQEYLGRHVVQRATSTFFDATDPWFYLRSTWTYEGPWALALGAGVLFVGWRLLRRRERRHADGLVFLWIAATTLPFFIAATQVSHYLLPAMGAVALTLGAACAAALERLRVRAEVGVALLAVVALTQNTIHLAAPDYSPDSRRFGLEIRSAAAPEALVTALDTYAQALFWYADRPLDFSVTSPRSDEILRETWVLERTGAVHRVTIAALAERFGDRPAYVLHPAARTEQLLTALRPRLHHSLRVVEGQTLNLLVAQPLPASGAQ